MFPLRDDNPTVRKPVAVIAIIALNALAWGWVQGFGAAHPMAESLCLHGLIPGELLGAHMIDMAHELGMEQPERLLIPDVARRQADAISEILGPRLQIGVGNELLTPVWSEPEPLPNRQSVRLLFRYALDAKKRVAVPAQYRAELQPHGGAIVLFPDLDRSSAFMHGISRQGFRDLAVAFGVPLPRRGDSAEIAGSAGALRLNPFSRRNQALNRQLCAGHLLHIDREGRILLPSEALLQCSLSEAVAFVGCGETFQIWDPARLAEADARDRWPIQQLQSRIDPPDEWGIDYGMDPEAAEQIAHGQGR